jgi:molybdopterin converting factor small subunit
LRELLNTLATEHESFGQAVFDSQSQALYNNIQVVINGRLLIPLKNLNVELRDGDRILFLPAYAGG